MKVALEKSGRMSLRKKMVIGLVVLCAAGLVYTVRCLTLTTDDINGFTGVNGIIRLNLSGADYVKLDENLYLVRRGDDHMVKLLDDHFDTHNAPEGETVLAGEIDGVEHRIYFGAFTGNYWRVWW